MAPFNFNSQLFRAIGALAALLLVAACTGCMALPSGWRLFGTPLEKQEKRVGEEQTARASVTRAAQAAVHQSALALEAAPPSRPVAVAADFVAEAKALLDQSQGAPAASDLARWRALVDRLLADNAEIRAAAERERERTLATSSALADKLAAATAARTAADHKVREYAAENERLADWVRKALWLGGALLALWLLSQALAIAARLNPAFAGASALVNTIAAPALHHAARRAQDGLHRVGRALAAVREEASPVAERIVQIFDAETDRDHQRAIAAGAATAGKPATS